MSRGWFASVLLLVPGATCARSPGRWNRLRRRAGAASADRPV